MKGRNYFFKACLIFMTIYMSACTESPDPEIQQYYSGVAKINNSFEKSVEVLSVEGKSSEFERIDPQAIKLYDADEETSEKLRILMRETGDQMSRLIAPRNLVEKHAETTSQWTSGFTAGRNDFFCSGARCYCGGIDDCNEMFDTTWACDFSESWPRCAETVNVCSCERPLCC